MLAEVGSGQLAMTEVHRFANRPVHIGQTWHWDILGLYREVLDGVRRAGTDGLDGIGIDSWAVDYGLLDSAGALIGNPVCYRDERTDGVMQRVLAQLGAARVYEMTGLQNLPFNTIYQLSAAQGTPALTAARRMLMLPDLLTYWLTGQQGTEITNASTTGLLSPRTRKWAWELISGLGLESGLFTALREPGEVAGSLLPAVAAETGLPTTTQVISVGSHDTASAVVGVPATSDRFAYISCGTWSLVGMELGVPVLTEASRQANFTNELGVDGTVRYLRNVMGLWLLQESVRAWQAEDSRVDLAQLLAAAARERTFGAMIDVDDPLFLPPGDMPGRIRDMCQRTGQPVPEGPAAIVRCILDSLAIAHARAVRDAERLSGRTADVVHIVGGGARNTLLCQLTADACGLPVLAGPVEATAYGNALVQARALGAISGGLWDLRELLRAHTEVIRYEPRQLA
jgi:rhamnulokinase